MTRIGLAVGTEALTAVVLPGRRRGTSAVERPSAVERLPAGALEDADALAATARALGARLEEVVGRPLARARVHVALLPPLADARLVQLPPLRPREAEAVLRRDAARHFVGGAIARVVGAAPAAARPGAVLAAAAPAATVEAVRAAVAAAGWRLVRIVPAHAAWRAAAAGTDDTAGAVIAAEGDAVHVLRFDGAALVSLRRMAAAWEQEIVAAAAGAEAAVVFGTPAERDRLGRALRAAGSTAHDGGATAAESAARHAAAALPELVPPALAAARRDRQRSIAWRLAAAIVLLLTATAAVELWGARRELDAVRARRAEIRDVVSPLLASRDSLARLEARLASIRTLDAGAPRWTRALFDIAMLLPEDARLVSLNTTGDTVAIEAAGARAGAALQALRAARSLWDVRLEGTVQRDLRDGETALERFRVRARLAAPEAWAPPPVTARDTARAGDAVVEAAGPVARRSM